MGHRKAISLISPWITSREAVTSILVYGETYEYVHGFPNHSIMQGQLQSLLLGPIPAYNLTFSILERYAAIRRALRPTNSLIGDVDTLIAATALEYSLAVVTANPRHFQRVPGRQVQVY